MPELPEVETIKNTLLPKLVGRRIGEVTVTLPRIIKKPAPEEFVSLVVGKEILDLSRRGKYLLLHLSERYFLVFHLRMTGRLLYLPAAVPVDKHTHLIFHLDNGEHLRFHDLRTFGTIYLVQEGELASIWGLASLGPEPLGPQFTPAYLEDALAGRRIAIKGALLNQELLAGLGNIYVDESLFRAGIHPARPAGSLTEDEISRLHRAIGDVLREGIRYRGTSFRDYVDGEGKAGGFQERLAVYGRGGQPCVKCGSPLQRVRIAGRGSVFCPCCQPSGSNVD